GAENAFRVALSGLGGEAAKALGLLLFASGKDQKQVMIGQGAEPFGTGAVILQERNRKDARCALAIFGFKLVERGQGNTVSAIEMAERFKEIGFKLVVRAFGRGLPGWIGACNFMNSHRLPPK